VAGSSGVVCTTADTPDLDALSMVSSLYFELLSQETTSGSSIDVAKALQQIKLDRLKAPKYANPSHWAPWVYHGRVAAD
jgi:hypothetical protein